MRVLWQGEMRVAAAITADLAGGKRIEGRTDGSGDFSVDATQPGIYTFRSKEVEKVSGERDGKKYTGILHYSTLVVIVVHDGAGIRGLTRSAEPGASLTANRDHSGSINWSSARPAAAQTFDPPL